MAKKSPVVLPASSKKPKSQKLKDRDEKKIAALEAKIAELEKVNSELSSQLKADFIDVDDKTLVSTEASAFRDWPEMTTTIKKYLDLNKSIKLYPLMKKCDTRDLGVTKSDDLVKELASVGIKFGTYDQKNFLKWAPQDKLGNVKYQELYNQVMNIAN